VPYIKWHCYFCHLKKWHDWLVALKLVVCMWVWVCVCVFAHLHTHTHTQIFHVSITVWQRHLEVDQVINVQGIQNFYFLKSYKCFKKEYCGLYLNINNPSAEWKCCVFNYFLNATLNFVFAFLRIIKLCG